jgi:hypothetical protein
MILVVDMVMAAVAQGNKPVQAAVAAAYLVAQEVLNNKAVAAAVVPGEQEPLLPVFLLVALPLCQTMATHNTVS